MSEKIVLVLVDGMRPDGMMQCGSAFPEKLLKLSSYSLNARTVFPSVTLPCHMSLFHSVDPDRHGITTNTYIPQVRPIRGMFDQFDMYGKKCAFFYTWEELRDLGRPDHLHTAVCINQHKQTGTDQKITDVAIDYINKELPDFTFIYLGETDERGGHDHGWMSQQYLDCIANAFDCIERIHSSLPEGYTLMVIADHGGHERRHGSDDPQDMTIPVVICGPRFEAGKQLTDASIKDIAVTAASLLEVPYAPEWEGKSLC